MIATFADFAAETVKIRDFQLKTEDYGPKLRILVENHGLWLKTADYGKKPWIMVENCGLWSKTTDFSQKPQILQFLSLKLQNCLLVFSPERGSKG